MTAKKKKEKKVMEEKRPSLPEVVAVRKCPRIPRVTLNRLTNHRPQNQGTVAPYLSRLQGTPFLLVAKAFIENTELVSVVLKFPQCQNIRLELIVKLYLVNCLC